LLRQNDRFVTVHNKCSKIPPLTSLHFATRVWRYVSFVRVDLRVSLCRQQHQNASEQFVWCVHLFLYTWLFVQCHKQKSNAVLLIQTALSQYTSEFYT